MPILTRYMTPNDYGIVAMFGILVSFTAPFIGLNMNGAIARQYYKDDVDLAIYITNCLFILFINTLLVSILFYLFATLISKISSLSTQIFWMIIVICFSQCIVSIVLTLWQVEMKPIKYGVFQISQTLLNSTLSIWFVVAIGLGWKGRIDAQLYTFSFFLIVSIYFLYKNDWLKPIWKYAYIKNSLKFGIPMIPFALGAVIITMTDRFLLTNMVGINATGLYTVGYQVGMVVGLLDDSFNKAYSPWVYEKLSNSSKEIKNNLVKYTYLYFGLILAVALIFAAISPWFLNFYVV